MGRRSSNARTEARQTGAPTYQGLPCKAGGHTRRYTHSGACVECQAAAQRKRRGTPEPLPQASHLDDLLG